jgi:large subunit ribosomal protein L21
VARLRDGLVRTQAEYRALKSTLAQRDDLIVELQAALAAQRELILDAEREREALQSRANATRDDLKRIRGIGPSFEQKLHALGVTSSAQIAAWTAGDIERIAGELGIPPARIARDGWIERAGELAR